MSTEADYRLPRTALPQHYDLTVEPDLGAARFEGSVVVDIEVVETTDLIVLNAAELEIADAEIVDPDSARRWGTTVELDPERERVSFQLAECLEPGMYQLRIDYSGTLNDELRGFYRSVYVDTDGNEQVIATTQFEATDARRAFPCWDEPDLKATFDVTLIVPPGLQAVSCSPIVEEALRADGSRRVRFGTTMKLSTYLLAFVVGRLEATEPVDAGGVPVRVIYVPGKERLTSFALEFGSFAIQFFSDYYGIPYPGDKVDLLAIPDFAAGAMENLGAITFRESVLLVDPATATQAEVQRVADVIAHEVAHMWFGDLATMRWWNGLWLKEAFATFMEMVCVDAFRPEWERWASFGIERDRSMDTDGLQSTRPIEFPVASPAEADAMFDVITYSKGAAVLRMLQQYLGEETFRRGISRYLQTHAYSTAETEDLWVALEAESGEPVADIMTSWIFQGGHPQIEVHEVDGGFRLHQQHFQFLGSSPARWKVPVLYTTESGEGRVLVEDDTLIEAASLIVNRGGHGYYRTQYSPELLGRIAGSVPDLPADERFVVVADAWANTLAGETGAAEFAALARRLRDDPSSEVWGAMLGGFKELNRVVSPQVRPAFEAFVRDLVGPQAERLGWTPGVDESDLDRRFRGVLLRGLGVLGRDPATIATARGVVDSVLAGSGDADGEVESAAIAIVASNGSADDHARFVAAFENAKNPQDMERYLDAMVAVPDETTALETFEMVLDGRIRSQEATMVIAELLGNRITGAAVWEVAKERWTDLLAVLPPFSARQMLWAIHLRSEPGLSDDIRAWLEGHPLPGGEMYATQQLERMAVRVKLREREAKLHLGSA